MTYFFQFQKNRKAILFVILGLLFFSPSLLANDFSFTIRGEVQHAGIWSVSDLKSLPVIPVRVREYSKNGQYRGLCAYWAVPLQLVLEMAAIQKSDASAFKHKSDMAIFLKNPSGEEITLSWGEIFYQSNPTHYLLAFRKTVVRPTAHPTVKPGSCQMCHNGKTVRKGRVLRQVLSDSLMGVKFLIVYDGKLIRALKNLQLIEVRSVNRSFPHLADRNHVFSNRVIVIKEKRKENLERFLKSGEIRRISYKLPEIGSGCGYHGTFTFQGYRLEDIFSRELSTPDFWGLIISAPDGYRTFVSRNEIVGSLGQKALLAISKSGRPLEAPEGKFMLILPNDLFFDRWIRAVDRIEILSGQN